MNISSNQNNQADQINQIKEIAILGGGCFWCVEAALKNLKGVLSITSGYCGGSTANPTYQEVCTGETGHIEVVKVEFAAAELSFEDLLNIFFVAHDPTSRDKQGEDEGVQYRSVIFYQDDRQKDKAAKLIADFNRQQIFGADIVTELLPKAIFWQAEENHLDYFARNPEKQFCQVVIAPKVAKLRQKYADKYVLS